MDKLCELCGQTKPIERFVLNKSAKSGYGVWCKPCRNARHEQQRRTTAGLRASALRSQRYFKSHRESERLRSKAGRTAEKMARDADKRRTHEPFKERARRALREAVRYGKIDKPGSCSTCGWEGRVHGHHEDYNRPLEVQWLCSICHGTLHRKHALAALKD